MAFATKELSSSIVKCKVQKNLHHGSDHYPIAIHLNLSPDLEPEVRQQAWKSVNLNQILEAVKKFIFGLLSLNSEVNIDAYMDQITFAL